MKVDSTAWLNQMTKNLPPAGKNNAAPAPAGGDRFDHLPHADFDTNLEKLRTRTLREPQNEPTPEAPNYNEPISNQDVDQSGFQTRLIENLGPQFARMQYAHDCSKLQGMIPTKSQLQAEFDKLAGNKIIPFEYIVDGCYARAHEMCDMMHQDNINTQKMFCMVENPYGSGKLTAENKYMQAKWWYHVAPMVWAVDDQSKKVEPFIMDPSMAKTPLKPEDWIHAMWDENTKIKVDVTRDPQFGPLEAGGPNTTFEESMADSREIMADYTKRMDKIKEQYDADHPSEPPAGGGGEPPAQEPPKAA